ncbi:DNA repair protein RecO [Bdellovibrio bacteriovorus]|uniref:DNA repair protein RecO n=1 Tax=Bdellovibrio bacteriovorus TaxID=959 RepID=A0A150WFY7_BDEBC|nr:DNA repair protein RecO [Bdellovibrio bacteriovorus]KYG62037.1 DNA repair protein RecO [Bdellovibrio bacteriovorus]
MTQGKDRFIILRKIKYSEADLILHALSPVGEKLSFIARGALKSKKRFGGGVLEPTHFVSFTYKQAEEGQLNVLQEATLLNDFPGIRKDYDRLELALHMIDCVSKVSQEGDNSSEFLFNLLGNALKAVETAKDPLVLKMHFYIKFLLQQGVVNAEPWMAPFFKAHLADTDKLAPQRGLVDQELRNVEAMVRHYLEHATL